MIRMDEADFWAKYGEEAAISAIAVIVEEGPPVKKRVVHDASHDVLLNHRIRCLDKILLFADDVEMIGGDKRGRRGIVLAYALLASLGFPFKWSKTKGGLNVQW
ncbi:unnamed protein product, partial [Symbiodinium microadriaticum]